MGDLNKYADEPGLEANMQKTHWNSVAGIC